MEPEKIFKHPLFDKYDHKEQLVALGGLALLLASAAEAADNANDELAWDILKEASKLGHPTDCPVFNTLYGSVAMYISWCKNKAAKKNTSQKEARK